METIEKIDASDSFVGYIYEAYYALFLLLNSDENTEIIIEKFDDVSLIENNKIIRTIETKHHKDSETNLTNSSLDFWKTLGNWMGYHIITHLALHSFFIQHSRPVPHFIIFDQPSQVYYPQDKKLKVKLSSDDEESLGKVFDLIFQTVENFSPKLQVIITEHADIPTTKFQSSIRERWRNGKALVPKEWLEK